jgi:hypothetical protein
MDGERFLRGQIPSRRALRVDEKSCEKIKKSLDFQRISDILKA